MSVLEMCKPNKFTEEHLIYIEKHVSLIKKKNPLTNGLNIVLPLRTKIERQKLSGKEKFRLQQSFKKVILRVKDP